MELKDKIKKRREELNMSLQQVADIVGVNKSSIKRFEDGEIKNIRLDRVEKIAQALQISPVYLMGWDEDLAQTRTPALIKEAGVGFIHSKDTVEIPREDLETIINAVKNLKNQY